MDKNFSHVTCQVVTKTKWNSIINKIDNFRLKITQATLIANLLIKAYRTLSLKNKLPTKNISNVNLLTWWVKNWQHNSCRPISYPQDINSSKIANKHKICIISQGLPKLKMHKKVMGNKLQQLIMRMISTSHHVKLT